MAKRHLLCAALVAAWGAAAQAGPLAYVPNEKSASLSVIDTADDSRRADIPAGERPRGIAAGGGRVYVTDGKTGRLLIIDTASGKLIRSVPVGASPEGVSLSADGRLLAVAVSTDHPVAATSTPDTATRTLPSSVCTIKGRCSGSLAV